MMRHGFSFKQKGAVAIEFAAVFIIFFAVFYGVVSYSVPLLMMQSFNEASAEAARRCMSLDPASENYSTNVINLAKQVIAQKTTWMQGGLGFAVASDADVTLTASNMLKVQITYPVTKLQNAIPFLVLPGVGTVPNLPKNLVAQSSLQL